MSGLPNLPRRFFQWYCDPRLQEQILGDLEEKFEEDRAELGLPRARRRFTWSVLRFFRRPIVRPLFAAEKIDRFGLSRHHLLIAFRGLRKDKRYAGINLLGLTLSLAMCLLIWIYVQGEKSVDAYHLNTGQKYRIAYNYYEGDDYVLKSVLTTHAMGAEALARFAGIKNMVRVRPIFTDEGLLISSASANKNFMEFNASYVENSFLDFFSFPLVRGERETALASPNNIVLTQETAKKYFGEKNPLGEVLEIHAGTLTGNFIVSGVLGPLPAGTHLDFGYLIPIDFLISHYGLYKRADGWQWQNFYTYFELEDGTSTEQLSNQINGLIEERLGDNLAATGQQIKSSFQSMPGIYLDPAVEGDEGLFKGSAFNIQLFSSVALILLVIAAINYVNLSSARAFTRKGEVSIRKAIGATKTQIIRQFITEAILLQVSSLLLAFAVVYLFIEDFSRVIGVELNPSLLFSESFVWIAFLSIISSSLLTGLYPALLSLRLGSSFISNSFKATSRGLAFKKILIGFQLLISLILVAGTWLVFRQVTFMKSAELGIDTQQTYVVVGSRGVASETAEVARSKMTYFKSTLLNHPEITALCGSSNTPGTGEIWYGGIRKLGDPRDKEVEADAVLVDADFTKVYQFDFLSGKPFEAGMRDYEATLINESAMHALGIEHPAAALEHSIVLENMDTMRIQGVVKDVHWNSLHEEIRPIVFGVVRSFNGFLSITVKPTHLRGSLELIEDTYREVYPNDPYNGYFLNDDFNRQYEAEQKFSKTFGIFSLSALLISGLGLLALITYSLAQREKEIGIRKVLGAGVRHLFLVLSREYAMIFGYALLAAIPLIFFGARSWLNHFAYRIEIDLVLFVIPTLAVALVTLVFISRKILSATRLNPVEQLRNE